MSSQDLKLIDGTARSVQEMFMSRSYSIEYYQREYSWTRQNIEELVQDLTRSFLNDYEPKHSRDEVASYRPYFLGPVVTFSKDAVRFLVDGQQRLTSLSLLMIFLTKELEEGESKNALTSMVYSEHFGKSKFTINVQDREAVMTAIKAASDTLPENLDESSKILWERYQDIQELFPAEILGEPLQYFCDWLRHRVILVEIGTTDKDMALEIFESMNDRGLQLSNMDMLKSYILSRIGSPAEIESANKLWRGNVQSLRDLVKNGDSEFMKNLLRAKYAETVRDTKKSAGAQDFEEIATTFHKWVRDKSEKIGLVKSQDFIDFVNQDLVVFASRYALLSKASEQITEGLEHVYYNHFNDFTLQNMVILASVDVEDSPEVFKRKANLVAAYIDIMITRRMVEYKNFGYSPMYRPMFQLAKELRGKTVDQIQEILSIKASEQTEKIDSIVNLRLTKTNKSDIYYILARMTSFIESEKSNKYFDKKQKDRFEVEHIWANKYERHKVEFSSEYEFLEHRNKVGDLLLLPKSFNASFGALEYSKKHKHYYGQNLLAQSLYFQTYENNPNFKNLINDFELPFKPYAETEFTRSAIDERSELFLQLSRVIWDPMKLVTL
jgi:uncharacterized protein with ParB-like and HNH nuclease domain